MFRYPEAGPTPLSTTHADRPEEPAVTTPTASATQPQPELYLDTPHQHTRSCYWDYLECRWECPRPPATDTE